MNFNYLDSEENKQILAKNGAGSDPIGIPMI